MLRPGAVASTSSAADLAGSAAPDGGRLLAERSVRKRLQRLVQRGELPCDAKELFARVQVPVERVHLVAETVEPLEQRVELTIADIFPLHAAHRNATSCARV